MPFVISSRHAARTCSRQIVGLCVVCHLEPCVCVYSYTYTRGLRSLACGHVGLAGTRVHSGRSRRMSPSKMGQGRDISLAGREDRHWPRIIQPWNIDFHPSKMIGNSDVLFTGDLPSGVIARRLCITLNTAYLGALFSSYFHCVRLQCISTSWEHLTFLILFVWSYGWDHLTFSSKNFLQRVWRR